MENSLEIKSATLLSIEETETLLTQEERRYSNWWWMRSPGSSQEFAALVGSIGRVHYGGNYVINDNVSVRPALEINLKSSELKVGDTFNFGDKEFKIISDNLAFCTEDIGMCCFREDWDAPDANIYDASDIKKFVDEWFEKAKKEADGSL